MAKAKRTRTHGDQKDFATKQTLNPPAGGPREGQTREPESRDAKRRIGQFTGAGDPSLTKK
ncbi:MAG TPA: hypothetical protein VFE37_10750 [Chloroflexota bacterium]|nr:hypothetical protein [Chloroflexota bacterium]